MIIAVIKPSLFGERAKDALPPLLFAILKPLTPPDIELLFFDENIEDIPDGIFHNTGTANKDKIAMAAITIDTFTARRGYKLAERFRKNGIPVVLGGIHATLCTEEAAQYADTIIKGEAEDIWGTLIDDLRAGELKPIYISRSDISLNNVQYDYSVFNGKRYNPLQIIQYSRGCRFSCDFCSIHAIHGNTLRARPAQSVIETILQLPNKLIFFSDDNLFSDTTQIDELLEAMKPLRRRWVCQISIDAARNPDLLLRLRKSGCIMVIIGFEALNRDNLKQMNKGANLNANYDEVIGNIRKAGLMLYGTFVIGYDADTSDTAGELVTFAKKNKFAIANFNPLIPTPGTELYKRLEREERLLYNNWWSDENYRYGDAIFIPKGMTPEELSHSCRKARYSFFSFIGITARLRGANIRGWYNLFVYLIGNVISGISIRQKQGRRLGE